MAVDDALRPTLIVFSPQSVAPFEKCRRGQKPAGSAICAGAASFQPTSANRRKPDIDFHACVATSHPPTLAGLYQRAALHVLKEFSSGDGAPSLSGIIASGKRVHARFVRDPVARAEMLKNTAAAFRADITGNL